MMCRQWIRKLKFVVKKWPLKVAPRSVNTSEINLSERYNLTGDKVNQISPFSPICLIDGNDAGSNQSKTCLAIHIHLNLVAHTSFYSGKETRKPLG